MLEIRCCKCGDTVIEAIGGHVKVKSCNVMCENCYANWYGEPIEFKRDDYMESEDQPECDRYFCDADWWKRVEGDDV